MRDQLEQPPLVTTSWLEAHLDDPELLILHASFSHSDASLEQEVIPNSLKLDLAEAFCDLNASQFRAMPTFEQFILQMRELGALKTHKIVMYDERGVYFSPRAWWMCRVMGVDDVYILDGGCPNGSRKGVLSGDIKQSLRILWVISRGGITPI